MINLSLYPHKVFGCIVCTCTAKKNLKNFFFFFVARTEQKTSALFKVYLTLFLYWNPGETYKPVIAIIILFLYFFVLFLHDPAQKRISWNIIVVPILERVQDTNSLLCCLAGDFPQKALTSLHITSIILSSHIFFSQLKWHMDHIWRPGVKSLTSSIWLSMGNLPHYILTIE